MISRPRHRESTRRIRLMASAAVVLLGLGALFRFWPATPPAPPRPLPSAPEHLVTIEEIVSTTQSGAAQPPPPPALPPVEVEEVEIEEVPLTLDAPLVTAPSPTPAPPAEAPPGDAETTQRPRGGISRDASPVRMVQPPIRPNNPAAEVVVEVIVDAQGRVKEAAIQQRFLLRRGNREPVAALDARLEAEALEVARRWMFRPALRDGARIEQPFPITLRWGTGN